MLTINVELCRDGVVLMQFAIPVNLGESGFHWEPGFGQRIVDKDALGKIELYEIHVKSKASGRDL